MRKFSEVVNGAPFPFQKEGIRALLEHNYFILADEQGLGKTYQAIAAALILDRPFMVVCPAYLKYNWAEEIDKFSKKKLNIIIPKNEVGFVDYLCADVLIVNYDILTKFNDALNYFYTVIVDEAQYLKNMEAKRTSIFHEAVCKYRPKNLIMLSGTPIKNNLPEFYSALSLCGYTPVPNNGRNIVFEVGDYWEFARKYSHERKFTIKGRTVRKFTGVKNLADFKDLLRGKYLRRMSSEVLDLPDKIRKDVLVDYKDDPALMAEFMRAGDGKGVTAKTNSALAKVPFTIKYVRDLMEKIDTPIVLYSDHLKPIEAFRQEFNWPVIQGDTDKALRHQIVKEFQEGKHPGLLATIGAASTGLTLTRSKNEVFNDISWDHTANDQAEKRIHRIGQTDICFYHRILGSKVDQHICKLVTEKMILLGRVL